MPVCVRGSESRHRCGSQRSNCNWLFYLVGPRTRTQAIRLGGKCFYPQAISLALSVCVRLCGMWMHTCYGALRKQLCGVGSLFPQWVLGLQL